MKFGFTIILLLLIAEEMAYSRQDDCCGTQVCQTCCQTNSNCCRTNSNCCRRNSNCCQSNSNCCQTSSSNCCSTNKNCCRTTDNSKPSVDCCKTSECKTQSPTETKATTIQPDEFTNRPTPARIIERGETVMNNSNINKPNVTFTLNMNNNFSNVNHISYPISIKNDNQQQISVHFWMKSENVISPAAATSASPTVSSPTTIASSSTTPSSEENITTTTTKPCVPIPILIPVPGEAPKPVWNFPGCCVMVSPCLLGLDQCTPYRRVCGGQCTHTYMYQPFNPCEQGGCYKRSYSTWNYCNYVGCRSRVVDCNYCREDFYVSYQGYNQCGGCYYV